ncbi:MAG: hypothetical protein ACJ780_31930 [Solirubrobacteraceae bacterium]
MRRVLIATAALFVMVGGAAAAQPVATWNSGYNGWWPSGFGYPPVTVHAPSYPCSVTAHGATFHSHRHRWTMDYGGGTSCQGGVGAKTITVSAQVLGQDRHTWHTITGSAVMYQPRPINPLRVIRNLPAELGHVYRTVATAKLVVPNGHAGCSLTSTCDQTIVIKATSRPLAP